MLTKSNIKYLKIEGVYFSVDFLIPSQISFSSMEVGIVPNNMATDTTNHDTLAVTI
jgi:hypothetical protein